MFWQIREREINLLYIGMEIAYIKDRQEAIGNRLILSVILAEPLSGNPD